MVLVSTVSYALDEYETVVVDQNFNSSSKIVINKKDIEQSHAKDIPSLLATQANISISQSGFQPNSIFLRGGDSSQILILVDGVPTYDPATTQKTMNLNSINLKSVQKIEVIKGSQSVLYGGQALVGVIKIETVPKELKTSGQVLVQGGTDNQKMGTLGGTLKLADQVAVIARGSYSAQDSKSPVLDSTQTYPGSLSTGEIMYVDRSRPVNVLLKLQTSFDTEHIPNFDNSTYRVIDDAQLTSSTYSFNKIGIFTMPHSWLSPIFSLSHQISSRLFQEVPSSKQEYQGELLTGRFEISPYDSDLFKLRTGLAYTKEGMSYADMGVPKVDADTEFESLFLKGVISPLNWFDIELGARTDYQKFKDAFGTWHAGLVFLKTIKLEASTGLKNPSLFQLFSSYGNPNLRPEESTSYSVSYENSYYENQISTSATVFLTQFENLITYRGTPPTGKYENVSSSETKGIELMFGFRPLNTGFSSQLSLGYQEPRDLDLDNWLPKRPLRTASLQLRQQIGKIGFGVEVAHTGDRRDKSGSSSYTTLGSYTLLNATADFSVTNNWLGFLRLQNLTNQRYESSYTYYDAGVSGFAGVEWSF